MDNSSSAPPGSEWYFNDNKQIWLYRHGRWLGFVKPDGEHGLKYDPPVGSRWKTVYQAWSLEGVDDAKRRVERELRAKLNAVAAHRSK